ncbi:MAG: DUF5683 domain-containing protein [Bacteroidota bacterium]|jgi:hypothetical protein
MKRLQLYSLVCLLVNVSFGSAQYISKFERPISTPIFFAPLTDSLIHLNEDSLIAAQIGRVDTTVLPPKSTAIAMVSSMLLPGVGQLYNESYWKAPVVWGFGYYFYSVYRNQDDKYRTSRYQYDTSITVKNPNGDAQLRSLRDFYKNQRNEFGWYLAITYVLNVLDAYVDAALYNFEVSPNLQGTNDWRLRVSIPIRR